MFCFSTGESLTNKTHTNRKFTNTATTSFYIKREQKILSHSLEGRNSSEVLHNARSGVEKMENDKFLIALRNWTYLE